MRRMHAVKARLTQPVARMLSWSHSSYYPKVVDDRGKFIYIMRDELEAMAKFIKRKGRVRISAIAQESNKLIDLNPRNIDVEDAGIDEQAEEPTGDHK